VPCGSEVGLGVAIASYNRNLHYGVTYDMQAAPDGELFRDFLIESYEELRKAAGVPAMAAAAKPPKAASLAPTCRLTGLPRPARWVRRWLRSASPTSWRQQQPPKSRPPSNCLRPRAAADTQNDGNHRGTGGDR